MKEEDIVKLENQISETSANISKCIKKIMTNFVSGKHDLVKSNIGETINHTESLFVLIMENNKRSEEVFGKYGISENTEYQAEVEKVKRGIRNFPILKTECLGPNWRKSFAKLVFFIQELFDSLQKTFPILETYYMMVENGL